MNRIIVFASLLFAMHASGQNAIFNGGDGDGYARNDYAEVAGNIFNGGDGDGWATASIMVSLPVQFTYFKAKVVGTGVLLQWETSSELDANRFDIERSEDGVHFNYLNKVAATGTSSVRTTYHYTDNSPLTGDNYYRLKQVDNNGNFVYTPVRMVSLDKLQSLTVTVYPQPAKEKVMIKLPPGLERNNVVINIINSAGGLEKQFQSITRTTNIITLPLSQLAKGMYFIRIHAGEKIYVSPLVVE